ncbi:MAG: hypothetical protein M9885_09215, partial [Burkholderiaceae bacterium]|nr:hypothetical protein [Burkholderiaceae bacterium]
MPVLAAAVVLLLATALTACGSGIEWQLFVAINAPPATVGGSVVVLSGTAALPAGSVRTGGTVFQPTLNCQPGTFSITWANDTNGARGSARALWDCPADRLTWSSSAIPLAPGANRITVTMVDAVGSTATGVTVIR